MTATNVQNIDATDPLDLPESPALRADHMSRLGRIIAKSLLRRVFHSEDMALRVAHEIVVDMVEMEGGAEIYVPTAGNVRAGLGRRPEIEAWLRANLDPEQLTGQWSVRVSQIRAVTQELGVGERTVYRVLEMMRG